MSSEKQKELDQHTAEIMEQELNAREQDQWLGLCIAFLRNGDWKRAEHVRNKGSSHFTLYHYIIIVEQLVDVCELVIIKVTLHTFLLKSS